MSASADVEAIRGRLRDEIGTLVVDAPESVAFVYPSPYHTGMSSLGYQTLYRAVNQRPGRAAHRAFLPDDVAEARRSRAPLLTYEALRPVSSYAVFALSVAYELELAGVVECLELSGLPPLAAERDERHPIVLAGGPLTFSNPLPLGPFADVILMGEADETIHQALDIIFSVRDRVRVLRDIADQIPSAYVPSLHGDQMPPVEKADDVCLPAYSQILTPHTELREMFLVEPERGCHRGCQYCVMRRSTNDGMRTFDIHKVLSLVPERARRVGLVGAAVTDHPHIAELVEALAATGREVGLSSLRADRLTDRLCVALRSGGQTVLTTASDGASQRLRDLIQRRAPESVLVHAAEFARAHGFKRLKLYMMLGLPGEEDNDIEELIDFSVRLSQLIPLSLGIAPFVAKRNTPLDGAEFAGIKLVDRRLDRLRKGVRGRVDVRGTSARWAWVEYVLAQGGQAEGRAVLDAVHQGGSFRAWKDAFDALPQDRAPRELVRPGNKLGRALQVLS